MMNLAQIQARMQGLNEWSLEGSSIVKEFSFPSFKEAMEFVNRISEIAERRNHHPDILISYTLVRINLTTHSEHGITEKDFDLAEAIEQILKEPK